MVFIWKFLVRPVGGVFDIYELLPAFIISCIVIIVISLLDEPPAREIVEEFESIEFRKEAKEKRAARKAAREAAKSNR